MSDYEELIKNLRSVKDTWQTQEEEWMLQAADAIEKLTALASIPQEMSAREYFKQVRRLQKWAGQLQQQYHKANETLFEACDGNIDRAIEEVEKWSREHPEGSEE